MNRTDRLVAIVLLLHAKKIVRAKDIAEKFGITLRTVYRDMKALNEAGVPIAAEAGEGYSLVEGYHLPPVMFTQDEANALYVGGEMVKQLTDQSLRYPAESGIAKIVAVLPEDRKDFLERLSASMIVMPRPSPTRDGFRDDALGTIQQAVVGKRVIKIDYLSPRYDAHTTREVEPLAVMYYTDHWHCIAYCRLRKDYRDFRTDRIRDIRMCDETFPARPDFSLRRFMEEYMQIRDPKEVRVRFDRTAAAWVRDRYYFGVVREEACDGGVDMTMMVPSLEMTKSWLLSFGTAVTVIHPPELRDMLASEAERLAQWYRGLP